jgi:toxin ParE1/3/4
VQIVWLKKALQNLDDIGEYIAQENPPAAGKAVQEIVSKIALLATQPAAGRPGRVVGTRELVVSGLPYLVPYRIKSNRVEILRVFHTSRKMPKSW